ncbi:A/G-specific adenine glycosylase [Anatilimnocola floriformis]|uniref:A/G-specific adenine glycosylase n=1 Tax=Anatilimnocola floriformis TaxID=2948575 RepID=UPI0020C2F8EE|nr:A/G-specific adenine glycosylase [Anatilimnocola floriformis]
MEDPTPPTFTAPQRRQFAKKLLAWFSTAARDLPWRRTRDLYSIWISEIMLQQTQVATVIGYHERFLAAFPNVAALAAAEETQVLRLWEGLGYYRRARQLHTAAKKIVAEHGGDFPRSYEAVRALPGIGRYTAGAILSIGLDQRLPILEANTIRVFSRLIALADDPRTTRSQARLWTFAEEILPAENCGAFNQALMELGSEICTPKAPSCAVCPVSAHCAVYAQGRTAEIPLAAKKTTYTDLTETAVVVRRGSKFLIRQCQPGERWAGLWDFPRFSSPPASHESWLPTASDHLLNWLDVQIEPIAHLATTKHGVTRFRITLHVLDATWIAGGKTSAQQRWVTRDELHELPLSVTGRKIAGLLAPAKPARKKVKS